MQKTVIALATATFMGLASVAAAANIVETARQAGTFNTLIAAAQAAGLADALTADGPLTVFAPTDEAFAALPEGTVDDLLKPENKAQLVAVLSYHVVRRELISNMLPGRTIHVKTIKGEGDLVLVVTKSISGVTVVGATVIAADIRAENGIVHVIDKVMLPSN